MSKLTHINSNGEAQMVDVSEKNVTAREAKAGAKVFVKSETLTSEDHIFQISRGSQILVGVHRYPIVQVGKS